MIKEELEQEAEEKYNERLKQIGYKIKYRDETYIDGYLDGAEPREKRIEELVATNKKISDECHKLVDSLENVQKENAELKADFLKSCKVKEQGFREAEQALERKDEQLTKAIEIIKKMLAEFDRLDVLCNYQLRKEAEQFLKE